MAQLFLILAVVFGIFVALPVAVCRLFGLIHTSWAVVWAPMWVPLVISAGFYALYLFGRLVFRALDALK